ncbi:MFS transporter [Luteimicrobium album]|uniref:MFS transporter n=1 Tax=Luteimicrobium album TaxID=1054550 RepID=A0ABQ6I6U2_9MICO|nr:MFS transporter [Luteimicrobium album]GMA25937.1 MFS transporter [Luteimicrobium album]
MTRLETVDDRTGSDGRLGAPFWRLWTAGVVNNLGDGALTVGVGLLAATVTHDPRLVAAVSAASMLPWLLVTLPAGVLVDRVDRIRTIRTAQLTQAVVMSVLTLLVALHVITVPTLAVLAFLVTSGDVVFSLASQSVLPQIVDKPQLIKANSATYLGQTISYSLLGQSLGGLLFATASALPFGFEAASFVASAAVLARLRPSHPGAAPSAAAPQSEPDGRPSPRRGVWSDLREGLRWLSRHRLLRTLTLVLGLNTFANQIGTSVLVLFATQTIGLSRTSYGLMVAASATGGIVGGLTNTRIVRLLGAPAALVLALALNATAFAATGLVGAGYALGALMALVGFSVSIWNVISVSMRQTLVPHELLGRVNSVNRLLGWGLMPLGALVGGFLGHWFGLRVPFFVTGGFRFAVLAAAAPVLLPALRRAGVRPRDHDA